VRLHPIIPGRLYQSANFMRVENRVEVLRAYGITTVVSLWHPDLELRDAVRYLHLHIPDGKRLDAAPVEDLALTVASDIRNGGVALVHCHAGRNRSGLLNALVVREMTNCTGLEAMQLVRRRRPRAIANPVFEAYLTGLQRPREDR
jgi:protein-tyrosine phosphatase